MSTLGANPETLGFLLWVLPPVAAAVIYGKLMWFRRSPALQSQRQIALASVASFTLCVAFLAGAAVVAFVFPGTPPDAYFGLAFPRPPGKFVAASFMFALIGVLLALHALICALAKGNRNGS